MRNLCLIYILFTTYVFSQTTTDDHFIRNREFSKKTNFYISMEQYGNDAQAFDSVASLVENKSATIELSPNETYNLNRDVVFKNVDRLIIHGNNATIKGSNRAILRFMTVDTSGIDGVWGRAFDVDNKDASKFAANISEGDNYILVNDESYWNSLNLQRGDYILLSDSTTGYDGSELEAYNSLLNFVDTLIYPYLYIQNPANTNLDFSTFAQFKLIHMQSKAIILSDLYINNLEIDANGFENVIYSNIIGEANAQAPVETKPYALTQNYWNRRVFADNYFAKNFDYHSTGSSAAGYGITAGNGDQLILNNFSFFNCRHGQTTTGGVFGCMNTVVESNGIVDYAQDNWYKYTGLDTHAGVKFWQISNVTIKHAGVGMHLRGKHMIVSNINLEDVPCAFMMDGEDTDLREKSFFGQNIRVTNGETLIGIQVGLKMNEFKINGLYFSFNDGTYPHEASNGTNYQNFIEVFGDISSTEAKHAYFRRVILNHAEIIGNNTISPTYGKYLFNYDNDEAQSVIHKFEINDGTISDIRTMFNFNYSPIDSFLFDNVKFDKIFRGWVSNTYDTTRGIQYISFNKCYFSNLYGVNFFNLSNSADRLRIHNFIAHDDDININPYTPYYFKRLYIDTTLISGDYFYGAANGNFAVYANTGKFSRLWLDNIKLKSDSVANLHLLSAAQNSDVNGDLSLNIYLTDSKIYGATDRYIALTGGYFEAAGNILSYNESFSGSYDKPIQLIGGQSLFVNNTFIFNRTLTSYYFYLYSGNNATFEDNQFFNLSGGNITAIYSSSGSNIILGRTALNGWTNLGNAYSLSGTVKYSNSNSGTVNLTSGNTSVVVTHNMNFTPSAGQIMVNSVSSLGSAAYYYVSNITSTQFTIYVDVDPQQTISFAWNIRR